MKSHIIAMTGLTILDLAACNFSTPSSISCAQDGHREFPLHGVEHRCARESGSLRGESSLCAPAARDLDRPAVDQALVAPLAGPDLTLPSFHCLAVTPQTGNSMDSAAYLDQCCDPAGTVWPAGVPAGPAQASLPRRAAWRMIELSNRAVR